ncbi:MAG: hypothetical protein CVU84_04830 [Firmicutes bacterium HGW-Firmicutes-1]|jgi:methyl-accepting chemotaxis protein|nr:MAG: hypothetical protein CVU84_04830 [Firmicutes bacterium HGW-Firmicutes-1]
MDYSSKKIYIMLLTVGMLCNLIIVLLFYFQSITVIEKTSIEKLKNILESNAMMIENNIENTELLSHELINIITSTMNLKFVSDNTDAMNIYEDKISPLFLNAIINFKAKSGWVVFDTAVVPSAGTISFTKNENGYIRQPEYRIRETEFYKDAWWVDAVDNGNSWSTPYYWERWDATIISYSEQIVINNKIIGVGGSDLFFEDISNQLKSIKLYDTGYVTLVNSNFDILFDNDEKNIGKNYKTLNNNQYAMYAKQIENGGNFDIIEYKNNDENKIVGYKKLANGWVLLSSNKKQEIYADLNKLNIILLVVIMIMIVLSHVYYRIIRKNHYFKKGGLR